MEKTKKAVSGEMKDRMLRCMVVKTRNRVVAFIYLVVIYFLESTSPDAGLHPVFLFYLKLGTIERNLQWDIYILQYISPFPLPLSRPLGPENRPMADQLLSTVPHHHSLPENYIRPESQRPRLAEVISDAHVPAVDLSSPDKSHVIAQIADACRSYGFFQVSFREQAT